MREVALVLAYYENPTMLQRQYANLRAMPARLQSNVRLIVVDDGSPDHPARPPDPPLSFLAGLEMHRMLVDVPWNQDACRNLAMTRVRGWALLTDMDHLPTMEALLAAVSEDRADGAVYRFSRVSEPDMAPYHPHPNSWLMTRATYDRIGGYDERWAGAYGTDGAFMKRVTAVAGAPILLNEALIRVPREVTPDASTTRYQRRGLANEATKQQVRSRIAALPRSERERPVRGRFPSVRIA